MGANSNPLVRAGSITGMLTFGTLTVVIQKLIFAMEGKGRFTTHKFEKPWFQTEAMFIGMFGCLFVYEFIQLYHWIQAKRAGPAGRSLLDGQNVQQKASSMPKWKQYLLVILPALCDMVATAMMNIGLLWINASVWQMLRGSMVIFSALFSKFFLKRELHASHWIGVATVAFALTVVAFSSLMPAHEAPAPVVISSSSGEAPISITLQVVGCSLVVFAQIVQASQIVIEEFLLHEVDLHAVLIVGLEGLWGGLVCSIFLVLVYWFPGKANEDSIDTLMMLWYNPKIFVTGIAYATAILCYNLMGMYVTQTTSAVIRTILEGLRCACIWGANLFIFYVIMRGNPESKFGERWTDWSYLQGCGFLFLLLGMFVYNGILRIEGLYYAPKKQATPAPTSETPAQEQK